MSGSELNKEVETQRRLPVVTGSYLVERQAKLHASESGVPAVNVNIS